MWPEPPALSDRTDLKKKTWSTGVLLLKKDRQYPIIKKMINRTAIPIQEDFSFSQIIYGHGWSELPPFEYSSGSGELRYVFNTKDTSKAISILIRDEGEFLAVDASEPNDDTNLIEHIVRHIFRLDEPMDDFYLKLEKGKGLDWIKNAKAGRLLRSGTVFEDLVKSICTTNCSWSLTKSMVGKLVSTLGRESSDGRRAFPTAAAMADRSEEFYREQIRAGYRSSYLSELAASVATGQIDPESWIDSELSTPELKKEIKSIKGVGDYAAENLLKLLGRYDGLALDSWLRSSFYKKHNKDKACKDIKIDKHYKRYGEWKGLAIWCDMSEEWIKGKGSGSEFF